MPSGKTLLLQPWSGDIRGLGPSAQMPLGMGTLGESVSHAASDADFEIIRSWQPGLESLVLADGCALGPRALDAAWQAGRKAGQDLRIELGGQIGSLLKMASLETEGQSLYYLHPGQQGDLQTRLDAATLLTLDPRERVLGAMAPGGEELALSDLLVLPVRSWLGLLWGNLLSLPPVLWRELLGSGPQLIWHLLRAFLRAGPRRIPQGLSQGGSVHPDAIVEASLLMEGASVEAGAVVRGCILGPGSRVEPLAVVEGSVLGPQAVVQRQAMVKYSVLGPNAAVGGAMQLGVLGQASGLKRGSYCMDQKLGDAPVCVPTRSGMAPVPLGMAGVCVGHGSLVGSGVWVAPGRSIPPGVSVVSDRVLSRVQLPETPGPYTVVDGRLESL